jgi:hypothetical protein
MECKLRCVNFRRVSGFWRAVWPAFGVTEIPDDWYRSTMGVIVISFEMPRSARENIGYTWDHLGAPATSRGVPTTSLGALATGQGVPTTSLAAPTTRLGAPATCLGALRNTVEQAGKSIFVNAAGVPGNHSCYLSFNDCSNFCIQSVSSSMYLCINVSMYLHSYPSTHEISELAAGAA